MQGRSRQATIEELAKGVVYELLDEIDPAEKLYPAVVSMRPLEKELAQVIDAAVDDWLLEKKEVDR
jgi:hypothetical protein